jgi:leukotriene-A4 hydrolase
VKVNGQPSEWEFLPRLEPYGTPLKIKLDQGVKLNEIIEVDVCCRNPILRRCMSRSNES